jgi:hypothetical protein
MAQGRQRRSLVHGRNRAVEAQHFSLGREASGLDGILERSVPAQQAGSALRSHAGEARYAV